MNKDQIKILYNAYLADNCTAEELRALKSWISDPSNQTEIDFLLDETWINLKDEDLVDLSETNSKAIFNEIINSSKKEKSYKIVWMKYAAAILLVIGLGVSVWIYNAKENNPFSNKTTAKLIPELKPGINKATLTLENGNKIDLHKDGIVVAKHQVNYTDGTLLVGPDADKIKNLAQSQYLSVNTPYGGEYKVVLSDGTIIWLNADSHLRYPADFDSDKRVVELEGEAYFEVAKMKKPFIVKTQNQEVKVLGTHFNINSYGYEEGIKTTLLEGSVMISRSVGKGENETMQSQMLVPGQQSFVSQNLKEISVKKVNTIEAVAWKEGLFIFNDEPIQSITKRLSKWYKVKFVYDGDFSKVRFVGNYARNKSLNNLLNNIELTGLVRFKVEGQGEERRIMVTHY